MAVRYGSVCSGVEAASLAWEPLGWTPAFFAEVDPFCCKLLAHRWPHVPNLGDLTSDTFAERAAACGSVDVLVGGTPCQSFSVAGKRGGLADRRGDLTLRYIDLVGAIRPAVFLWENVPGVLSQDGGRAFGTVIGKMADLGYRLAWRVLDAANFGVPQRRRRVFVVGCLGTRCPGKILALAEGEGRDPEPGGAAGAAAAAGAGGGAAAVTPDRIYADVGMSRWRERDASGTLTARDWRDGYASGLVVTEAVCVTGGVTHALTRSQSGATEDGTDRGTPIVAVAYQCHGTNVGPMGTLRSGDGGLTSGVPFVVAGQGFTAHGSPASEAASPTDTAAALRARAPGQAENSTTTVVVQATDGVRYVVRRLMPVECERLQGMPDGHTLIPVRRAGRKRRKDREYAEIGGEVWELAADGPRYRAVGNSMAVPVMRAIGERIAEGGVRWR